MTNIILGACNPPLAYETLQEEINKGISEVVYNIEAQVPFKRAARSTDVRWKTKGRIYHREIAFLKRGEYDLPLMTIYLDGLG